MTTLNAKSRLISLTAAVMVTAAQHAQVQFKDGSEHKVSFYGDPGKRKGNFSLKSPGLPNLRFNKDSGKYRVYTFDSRANREMVNTDSMFDTKTDDPAEAYQRGIKKFWKAI